MMSTVTPHKYWDRFILPLLLGIIGSIIASCVFQWQFERSQWATVRTGMDREILHNRQGLMFIISDSARADLLAIPRAYLFRRDFFEAARSHPERFSRDPQHEYYERAYSLLAEISDSSKTATGDQTRGILLKKSQELDTVISELGLSPWQ